MVIVIYDIMHYMTFIVGLAKPLIWCSIVVYHVPDHVQTFLGEKRVWTSPKAGILADSPIRHDHQAQYPIGMPNEVLP